MRQMIGSIDIGYPTIRPDDVHPSHWMKNDSCFFVWPVCQRCHLNAVSYGHLLTKPCGRVTEDDYEQQLKILQCNMMEGKTIAVSRSKPVSRIKSFFVTCFMAYARAMEHYRH